MKIRTSILGAMLAGALLATGCDKPQTGPIQISAIGEPPRLMNPNLSLLDAPAKTLLLATAQGLVQFDAAGQIEPGLAQSWIVSDDGLRYTFRIRRTQWSDGGRVTAQQVVERLRAASSRASINPLKPLLGAIEEIVPMTDEVLEISLVSPRPNFLQLLAQPEMAIMRNGRGTGPYRVVSEGDVVALHRIEEAQGEAESLSSDNARNASILLRGERAGLAVARFISGKADLVIGGTVGDLPIAQAAKAGDALAFDPVAGLFGLSFASHDGLLRDSDVRNALSMAIDRVALVSALGVPNLQPRETLLPVGVDELPRPTPPEWANVSLPMRRARATEAIASATQGKPFTVRVAMPSGPGYRLIFAHLHRDWRTIGVEAEHVAFNDPRADLRLIDRVAPVEFASWYLRQFACTASAVCDVSADEMMAAARIAPAPANRQALLANADRILANAAPFIALAAPVRWSLVSTRLTGFKPNQFGRHNVEQLIADAP